jgi:HAE1 family hydrophobic/amphiphilic exporter-1/multidrug efflux pump
MGGMLTGTLLAIFFVPLFFILVQSRFSRNPAVEMTVNNKDKGSNHE